MTRVRIGLGTVEDEILIAVLVQRDAGVVVVGVDDLRLTARGIRREVGSLERLVVEVGEGPLLFDLVPIEVKPIDPPPEDDDEVPAGRGLWVMEAVGYLFGIAVCAFLVKLYFSARQNKIPDDNHIQPDIDMVVDETCNFDEVPEPPESSE